MTEWIVKDARRPEMLAHPSTKLALTALQALKEQNFRSILDLGCGSGILSLAALEFWPEARLVATDISAAAVVDCEANLRAHAAEAKAVVARSDGYGSPAVHGNAPYDLILCNLLAELLAPMARDLDKHLVPGGIAVLSGILAWQREQIAEAHTALGFEILAEYALHSWRALVLRKR